MPWKESCVVSERMRFIVRLKEEGARMSDLCREFEISRKTGYKLLARYEEFGPEGLFDFSRRPKRLARVSSASVKELFIATRKKHSTWGPRKIIGYLEGVHPDVKMPAPSTVGDWLQREGLVKVRKRRQYVAPYDAGLSQPTAPNGTWCVDYKGQFRLGNGMYCYPLTVTDQFSRYLLACEGFEKIGTDASRQVFERLFDKHGIPDNIRSDNGSPFASRGLLGLTRLSVFWAKFGIVHERIEPGHPEQNGRHERMHRTLKAETTRPAKANILAQQERFDAYIEEFNTVRPHEALNNKTPASVYTPSERVPRDLTREYALHDDFRVVSAGGHINILRARHSSVFLASALAGERVGLRELDDGRVLISFAALALGHWVPATKTFHAIDKEDA